LPKQEPGVRPARALPYVLNAHGSLQATDNSFRIDFANTGAATPYTSRATYTVEPGKSLSDTWQFSSIGLALCDLSVYGPNGFYRAFKGAVSSLRNLQLDVTPQYSPQTNGIILVIRNNASSTAAVDLVDRYEAGVRGLSLASSLCHYVPVAPEPQSPHQPRLFGCSRAPESVVADSGQFSE
jgi:phospholipase C